MLPEHFHDADGYLRFPYQSVEYTSPWFTTTTATSDHANADAPAAVCEHPAALLKLADALATCDGCGRVFELRDFGK